MAANGHIPQRFGRYDAGRCTTCSTVQQSMIREVGVTLDKWAGNLSHAQRKDLYNALDWYHADGLYATKRDGKVEFMELPEGKWPTTEMSLQEASRKFDQLQSIKWLKLEADYLQSRYG